MEEHKSGYSNGSGPLSGWVLAILGGKTYIGKPTTVLQPGTPIELDPVVEMMVQLVPTPNGTQVVHQGTPCSWLSSLTSIRIPAAAIIVEISSLSDADRTKLSVCYEQGRQVQMEMRAAQSGIALAGPGTKLPPMPRPQ